MGFGGRLSQFRNGCKRVVMSRTVWVVRRNFVVITSPLVVLTHVTFSINTRWSFKPCAVVTRRVLTRARVNGKLSKMMVVTHVTRSHECSVEHAQTVCQCHEGFSRKLRNSWYYVPPVFSICAFSAPPSTQKRRQWTDRIPHHHSMTP